MVTIERHEKLDKHPGSNHTSPIYKQHYQLHELHGKGQPIIIATSLILGGAGFVYLAIPNPQKQTALNPGESHKSTSRLLKLL